MSDSIVIIPTYNEEENVEKMIRKVMSFDKVFHVLFVDDSSPDGTGEIIQTLQLEFPDFKYRPLPESITRISKEMKALYHLSD